LKTYVAIWTVAIILANAGTSVSAQQRVTVDVTPAFSPVEDLTTSPIATLWETAISQATQSVRITLYSFTSVRVRAALFAAFDCGVDVRVIADNENGKACTTSGAVNVRQLDGYGIVVKVYTPNRAGTIVHDKYLLVDNDLVVTGSANFTTAAQQFNHENQTMFRYVEGDHSFFDQFSQSFEDMWSDIVYRFNGTFSPYADVCP
jgi:phosphatidylserine/phosphatidylglycerophosphate/cardiolipin synthase-like enzyme